MVKFLVKQSSLSNGIEGEVQARPAPRPTEPMVEARVARYWVVLLAFVIDMFGEDSMDPYRILAYLNFKSGELICC